MTHKWIIIPLLAGFRWVYFNFCGMPSWFGVKTRVRLTCLRHVFHRTMPELFILSTFFVYGSFISTLHLGHFFSNSGSIVRHTNHQFPLWEWEFDSVMLQVKMIILLYKSIGHNWRYYLSGMGWIMKTPYHITNESSSGGEYDMNLPTDGRQPTPSLWRAMWWVYHIIQAENSIQIVISIVLSSFTDKRMVIFLFPGTVR